MESYLRLDWTAIVNEAVKRRKSQGLTQARLAILAGVSKPTIHSFEQGRTTITLANVLKILYILGLD